MSARLWFARDTGFTSDPKVQRLGDEHGASGPLAVEEMMALAKLADEGGSFTASYATLARRAFMSTAKAKRIVAASAAAGLIEVSDGPADIFTASFVRWSRWQPKDPRAAARKAAQRERERHAAVTP